MFYQYTRPHGTYEETAFHTCTNPSDDTYSIKFSSVQKRCTVSTKGIPNSSASAQLYDNGSLCRYNIMTLRVKHLKMMTMLIQMEIIVIVSHIIIYGIGVVLSQLEDRGRTYYVNRQN